MSSTAASPASKAKRIALDTNDGLIIAETSLGGMRFLVSSDQHLLGIPTDRLAGAMQDKHLAPVEICHPKRFLRLLGRR